MAQAALVLASASPRRRQLLAQIGLTFEAAPVAIDETPLPGEAGPALVERLARDKAGAAAARGSESRPILGADTTVAIDGEALGKPADDAAADAMLARLSGRTHQVHSGIAVHTPAGVRSRCVTSQVTFRPLSAADRAAYCATGEPAGKAGGYAIQGLAAVFVRHLKGSYSNVVGLPLFETAELLSAAGIDPLAVAAAATSAGESGTS